MTRGLASLERATERLSLERPDIRAAAVAALVVLTLVSPYVPLPDTLPAVRLEQLLLLILVAPLITFHVRHPEHRAVGIVDLAFFGIVVSTVLTVALTPFFVPSASRSPRDVFELAWIAQLWIVYRLARTIRPPTETERWLSRALAVAAVAFGVLAILQFLDPPGFNDVVTAIWTQAHNLVGVEREGRAVGTAGNANQFGMIATLLLVVALASIVGTSDAQRRWLFRLAITGAMVAIVLSQSRGALLAAGVALVTGLLLSLLRRQGRVALSRGLPPVLLGAVLAFGVMLVAPPDSGTVLRRFDPIAILRDPSVIIRLGRLQAVLATDDKPGAGTDGPDCVSSLVSASPAPGHEPGPAAPPDGRDPASHDVLGLGEAVARYYCRTGSWPSEDLRASLVPGDIQAIPTDPVSGDPYPFYANDRGFAVGPIAGAQTRTADSESVGVGSFPNLLMNPSFESGAQIPSSWLFTPGVALRRAGDVGAAFGASVGHVHLPQGGAVYQLVVADLPKTTDYLAGIWVRASSDASVQMYVVAIAATGHRIDPLAAATIKVPGDGAYHRLLLPLRTPDEHLTSLQVMVRSPTAAADLDLDGAMLTESRVTRAFVSLVEGDAAATGDAVLRESPILGLGPQKDSRGAAFDNEYVSFLAHYGLLGLAAYLFLFAAALIEGLRVARRHRGWAGAFGVALVATTAALWVFAISAGAYRQLQVMVIFWLVVGLVATNRTMPGTSATTPSSSE